MCWPIARNRGSTPTSSTASDQAAGAEVRLLPITRLEVFSDAMSAIAITLLVLELRVPAGNEALVKGLDRARPGRWIFTHRALPRQGNPKNRRNLRLQPAGPPWNGVTLARVIPPVPRPH